MKVIIEIDDETNCIEVTEIKLTKEDGKVFINTMHNGYAVEDLEKVHESCKGCRLGKSYTNDVCTVCINYKLWEAQNETNT